ncbi:NFACT-R-1 domain-containing protein [Mycena indigotica]|uniref:NFACT-R-1 domain-containing protein n=1 Tax=Mycena indigotica TaxID=2126181 RepID=A0A8H6WDI2_9AGAR|nr:NFACT-R-1 domain-containing protein [Mycena indigotica]KAF7312526.1 NFACT-R-1 domain-containing protein [Mycena indigotica]
MARSPNRHAHAAPTAIDGADDARRTIVWNIAGRISCDKIISHAFLTTTWFYSSLQPVGALGLLSVDLHGNPAHATPITIYMGKDKVENEDLIKYALTTDIWFHVDKLSSAHVYLRLPEDGSMSWEAIPMPLLTDCAQLVKANSIEGNKKDNLTIIYTPADNLKKTGDMAVGQVSFHNDKRVKRGMFTLAQTAILPTRTVHVATRENPIVNRLNKTKVERVVDHEQDRVDRLKREGAARRAAANEKKKADAELAKMREEEKNARSYDTLFEQQENEYEDEDEERDKGKSVRELEDDFM